MTVVQWASFIISLGVTALVMLLILGARAIWRRAHRVTIRYGSDIRRGTAIAVERTRVHVVLDEGPHDGVWALRDGKHEIHVGERVLCAATAEPRPEWLLIGKIRPTLQTGEHA